LRGDLGAEAGRCQNGNEKESEDVHIGLVGCRADTGWQGGALLCIFRRKQRSRFRRFDPMGFWTQGRISKENRAESCRRVWLTRAGGRNRTEANEAN